MDDPERVLVQATRPYLEGFEHKSERSEPYAVTRSHGLELQAQGFATIVSLESSKEAEPEAPDTAPAEDPQAATTAPRRRGRPPKAR